MFEDIIGNEKKNTDFGIWTLHVNNKEFNVEVFNVVENDRGRLVGFIRNNTHTIDIYTNYMMSMPLTSKHLFTVMVERIDKYTLKFSTPKGKRRIT